MNDTWWITSRDLNSEQEAVVRILGEGDYLITGPPGSGKTNALMLRAEYLNRRADKNYQVIVFTSALKQFLAACPAPYAIPPNKLKTLSGWLMETISAFHGQVSHASDFEVSRDENVSTLLRLVEDEEPGRLCDTLLLDEAQDFTSQEVALFRKVAKQIYAVADGRQRIYKERGGLAALRQFCTESALTSHYRNGRAICRVADHVGSRWDDYAAMLPSSMYNETDMPSGTACIRCHNLDAQIVAIQAAIEVQLDAYPGGMIGVMAPKKEDVEAIGNAFRGTAFWPLTVVQTDDDGLSFGEDTRICVCTVHSGKGLEFRAAHVAAAEHFKRFGKEQWRMVYTAVTRAKTRLSVYHSAAIPPFLEAALAAGEEHDDDPALDDLFK